MPSNLSSRAININQTATISMLRLSRTIAPGLSNFQSTKAAVSHLAVFNACWIARFSAKSRLKSIVSNLRLGLEPYALVKFDTKNYWETIGSLRTKQCQKRRRRENEYILNLTISIIIHTRGY